jgi:hypothetical protein
MRFLSNYLDFIFEAVAKQEMRLYFSDEFRNILKRIQDKSSIAQALLGSEDSNQILDIYTLIDITEKNDTISLIQVNRITRGNPELGETLPYNIRDKKRGSEFWTKARTDIGIGRWVRRIFIEVHKSTILESKIEEFVNLYKAAIDGEDLTNFELISGEDIKKWYLKDNYERERGQLGNSCMRYRSCQDFFDIYVKNPEVCQLLILKPDDDKDKIKGRALVWKLTDGEYYMDRIYTINDSDKILFQDYARINKIKNSFDNNSGNSQLIVKLGDYTYQKYPYMDTFVVYNPTNKILRDDEDLWPGQGYISIQDTQGGFRSDDAVYSDWDDEYISRENAVYCANVDGWLSRDSARYLEYKDVWAAPTDDVVWSEYHTEYFFMDDAIYSEIMSDILYPDNENVIKIEINSDGNIDWGVKSRADLYIIEWIDEKPRYLLREDCIKDPFTGEYHFKDEKVGEDKVEYSKYLDKTIAEKLGIVLDDKNTDRNGNPTDVKFANNALVQKVKEDLKNLMKDFEITDEIKSAIKNNSVWNSNVRGVFWGVHKDNMPTEEDMFLTIKAYPTTYPISNPYRHVSSLTINTLARTIIETFSGNEKKFTIFRSEGILRNMMKAAYIFDYSLFPEEIYLRYLFITV